MHMMSHQTLSVRACTDGPVNSLVAEDLAAVCAKLTSLHAQCYSLRLERRRNITGSVT